MTTTTTAAPWSLTHLPADVLLAQLGRLVERDRQLTAELLAHLAEVDARKLYLEAACSSLFGYCIDRLRLSEPAAYKRVRAARAARASPVVFDMIARGELHLAAVTLLAPHLTAGNHRELLAAAVHRSKRAVEELVAARFPAADVPPSVRKLPVPRAAAVPQLAPAPPLAPALPLAPAPPAEVPAAPAAPAVTPVAPDATAAAARARAMPRPAVAPLAPDRYHVQFTASREVRDRLREAQDLLRREVPDGDLDAVIGQALELLVRELKRKQFAATPRPRLRVADGDGTRRSAHIPNAVKRAVAERDRYQCTFVDVQGRRCAERGRLEFHHCEPQGQGGVHSVDSVTLRCQAHHALATARDYGAAHIAQAIAARRGRAADAGHQTRGEGAGQARITAALAPGRASGSSE